MIHVNHFSITAFVLHTQGLHAGEAAVAVGRKGPLLIVSPEAPSPVLLLSNAFLLSEQMLRNQVLFVVCL